MEDSIDINYGLLQAIIDSSTDVIQVFKAVRNAAGEVVDFRWQLNNSKAVTQNGHVIGESLLKRHPGILACSIFKHMVQVVNTGSPYEGEQYYSHEQFLDQWFYHTIVKQNDGIVMTTRDITREKKSPAEEAKHFLAAIVESSQDSIVTVDFNSVITSWNKGAENLYGYPATEAIGKPITMVTLPEDLSQVLNYIDKVKHSKCVERYETTRVRKQGQLIDLEIELSPVKNDFGAIIGVSTIARDITARKRAEEVLRISEEQFRKAIEAAPIPMIMHAEDGEVLQINRTWTELTGFSKKDLSTFGSWLNLAYGYGAELVRKHMHELFNGNRADLNAEFMIVTREGEKRYWSFSASAPGTLQDGRRFIVGMAVDITERTVTVEALAAYSKLLEERVAERTNNLKVVAESLHHALEQFQTLVVNTPDLITRWDKSLRLIFANRAMEEKMGVPVDALAGKTMQDMGLPESVYLAWNEKLKQVFKQKAILDHYHFLPASNGESIFFSHLIPEFDPNDKVVSVLAIGRDITDLKKAERELLDVRLAQQKEILNAIIGTQEQERECIGEALHNGIAQLLYAIQMRIQLMKPSAHTDELHKNMALSMIDQAIKDTRTVSFELVPTVLRDHGLLVAIRALCVKIIVKPLHITIASEGKEQPLGEHVTYALYRIVQELINNIIKHSKATEGRILLKWSAKRIRIFITDNGTGFDVASKEIKGIGLQSIQNRVRLLKGSMSIVSDNLGTKISIAVPLAIAEETILEAKK